jgi:diguanylate cyclase (GGDEF)-like protein/PAS domain S-box-containing protein
MGLKQLTVALLYTLIGTVIHHYFTNQDIGILWPANGLGLAVVLIGGKRYLWSVLLGSVLLYVPFKESLFSICSISLANTAQVFIGHWLLTQNNRPVVVLNTLRDYLRVITLGGFVASMLAAIVAAGILLLTGLIPSADYFITASRWWMGNSLGIVLVTPLILAWWQTKSESPTTKQYLEAILLVGITFILGQVIFLGWLNEHLIMQPKAFIMFLPITLIAIRLGIRATTLTLNMIAIQALLGAYLTTGYFANEITSANLYNYWLYILILSGIGMALSTYVNELKQKELSLRKSESQLRLSQNSGGVGTWEADLITNKLIWSDSCRALIGFIREPRLNDFINALYPEDRQRVINAIQSHIKHGTKYEVEYRVVTATSSIRWIRSSGQVERNAQGKPIIMRGIAQDITEHHKNQQRIERLLEEQRAILENRLVGIATVRNKKIVWANPAYEIMLGYKKGETVGVSVRHFYAHEQDYQVVQHSYRHSDTIVRTQHELIRKDGRHIWVDVSHSLLHKETGEALLVFIDVTKHKHSELKLIDHNKQLNALIEAIPDAIFLKDANSRWLITNELAKQLFRLHDIPWQGKTEMELAKLHPEFSKAHKKCLIDDNETWKTGRLTLFNEQVVYENGQICDFEVRKVPIFDDNGQRQSLVILGRDVTERKQVEAELRIAAIAFESQEGMFITDANNVILRVNGAFTHITGYTAEEVVGKDPSQSKSGLPDAGFYRSIWSSIQRIGSWSGEVLNRRKNGEIYPAHLTITAVRGTDDIISNYVSTLTDVTIKKAAENEIERLAFYDPLTNLPNRRLLMDRLKKALASSARNRLEGALLFIDLDNFKTLNDTLGHHMGDLLLQQVAERLTACVREDDTVARLGGDEFVIMLENLSQNSFEAGTQAELIGEKILFTLNQPYQLNAHHYHSAASIGITLFNNRKQSIEELLKQADIAMYQAKTAGRNTLRFFDPEMQANIAARVALEADLRLALEENQFQLYYQSQVYNNNKIVGAEVLIRWHHPERGMVPPVSFIPLAEEIGLIVPIGQWVLETACAQIKVWENSVHTQHLQLAVNVSARQFRQADFVEQVSEIIERNGIKADRLKLELTESLILDNIDDTIHKMNSLRKIDVRFSMDDFGTGYSSLAYLTQLPLDQLKIDQSFIRNIGVKPADAVIVQTIIGMGNNLGMEVIAEGVETEKQRTFLAQHQCHLFQGYLFAKPVPIKEFELLLTKNKGST